MNVEPVVAAWQYLPSTVQAAIVTLVDAAHRGPRDRSPVAGHISVATIAAENELSPRVVRRRLALWRRSNDAWFEVTSRKCCGDRYLYDADAVAPVVAELRDNAVRRRDRRKRFSK